ncbi:hypothetical protein HYC85_021340 [Camellia sinensis]|uniref:Uncharacterized protein n=1 Tax=Camellia sinensis TaxID=4442 RepID=A0A7J7GHE6_CAMSI|nr:hypothetical protein HYC85_021340 [Camellia sinensis]
MFSKGEDLITLLALSGEPREAKQCEQALPLWEDLRHCEVPLLLVVREKGDKFRRIAKEMFHEVDCSARSIDDRKEICEIVEVPSCGHALHLENPLPLINAIRQLSKKMSGRVGSVAGKLGRDGWKERWRLGCGREEKTCINDI